MGLGLVTELGVCVICFPVLVCRHIESVHMQGVACDSGITHMQACTVSPFTP